ncbi:uncharacterized protein BJ171DRAFT_583887 [Polychytrium aggregatum]|uniref:uncharacterized protein n=1 Tax=Polychytrium aggregatum TaxID=110093 RepID=UPI0022FE31A2|nr:uncharacterized protein BJ171DRAFT_583887 [Polychytrium aggregatum]KAI9202772.1 hypothetical protein BJ171DRAFT_583887 [Polychytrium aggregatum]
MSSSVWITSTSADWVTADSLTQRNLQVTQDLYDLAHSAGIDIEPKTFFLILEMIRMGIPTSSITQLLKQIHREKPDPSRR